MAFTLRRNQSKIRLELELIDLAALKAFMDGDTTASEELKQKGAFIYNWLFSEIQNLAVNYHEATKSPYTTLMSKLVAR